MPCTQSGVAAFTPNKDLNMHDIVLGSALIPVLVVSCTHAQSDHAVHMHLSFAQFPEPSGSDLMSPCFSSGKKARFPCARTTRKEGLSARDARTSLKEPMLLIDTQHKLRKFQDCRHASMHTPHNTTHMHAHPRAHAKR